MNATDETRFFFIITDAGDEVLQVHEWILGRWIPVLPELYHSLIGSISLNRVLVDCVPTWNVGGFYREVECPTSMPHEGELRAVCQELVEFEGLEDVPGVIGFFTEA